MDPVGSNKGAGPMGRFQGALGGTLEVFDSYWESNKGPALIRVHGGSISYIKASIQGLL